ncbi:MAG TPA: pyruvate formate lyase family protein [Candidatus Deferrimicrobium sp.]|nr:pyruvate formate lyase family protein [Candidatus Deferrimicrobium sp.]
MKAVSVPIRLQSDNKSHKKRLLSSPHWLCMERAKFYTESYRETEGEHPSIRAAKALRKNLENMTIKIYPEEILVGNRSSHFLAPPIAPERGDMNYVLQYLLPALKNFGYVISPEDEKVLFEEIIPYWKGKSVREIKVNRFDAEKLSSKLNLSLKEIRYKLQVYSGSGILNMILRDDKPRAQEKGILGKIKGFGRLIMLLIKLVRLFPAIQGGAADNVKGRGRCIDTQAHIVVGHNNVLKYGFIGIRERAIARLESAKTENEKNFLKSVEMVCESMRDFSQRFAKLAKQKADKEANLTRKEDLLEIARMCEKVPWNPPESFYEALQALWFTQNAIIISYGAGSGITPGRVDQLLYPYYKRDMESGKITERDALRLIEEFIIKINNNVVIWPNILGVNLNHLGSDIENITLGGVTREGKDAVNELTYLFIEGIRNTKLATSASFRISKKSPKDYIRKVVELHRDTNGPAFFNDEINIPTMMNDGYSVEAARDYCIVGCVEQNGSGDTFGATGGSKIYFPTILDLIFNRGKTSFFGNFDTLDTGNPEDFKTFKEFMNVYYKHMECMISMCAKATNLRDDIWAEMYHNPLISCTIDGCIENARDMTEGSAIYNFGAIGAGGLGTVVDSLAAIKKFVYEEKRIKMKDLVEALKHNFKNNERLRQILKNGPKFGNDDDYVDSIAVELVDRFCKMVRSHKRSRGGHFKGSFISYGLNVYEGAMEPATPDGRKASEPLSNSISPSNGAEMNGPTATLNSLSKIDHTQIGFGNSLNMKFPGNFLNTEKGIETLETLILTYFDMGGYHVQFNVIGTDTLRDAQLHPENYEDLIVRVSGYAAYFTQLGKQIQEDIIERTEFCNC